MLHLGRKLAKPICLVFIAFTQVHNTTLTANVFKYFTRHGDGIGDYILADVRLNVKKRFLPVFGGMNFPNHEWLPNHHGCPAGWLAAGGVR